MLNYFVTLSTDSVLQMLSLCNRQGYSVLLSLVRKKSTSSVVQQSLLLANNRQRLRTCSHGLEKITKRNMGSIISRGRKYSPNHTETVKSPNNPVEHARFACGDSYEKNVSYVEGIVCKEDEIGENQMKVVDLGEDGGKVLLVKQKGKISALGTKCTHYGAPLVNGHLGDGRIRCQWHGACFNINTGDIEDFPGLDSLPCYKVSIENGDVKVRADKEALAKNKRIKTFTCPNKSTTTFIVVGGGPAGSNCVETLRQNDFTGRIVLITAEPYLPYDRVKLSKSLDVDVKTITLRSEEFYNERGIEVMLSTELVSLNPKDKVICLSNGKQMRYDKLFLATGSTPRRLCVNGSNLQNIFVLRTAEDAKKIKEQLSEEKNVVILGTSFIGMEAAAYCVSKVKSVTVIGRDTVPFKKVFGETIGQRLLQLFQEKGVNFRLGCNISSFEGENGKLERVQLTDCSTLDADICIVGIGTVPNTNYLQKEQITLDGVGNLEVNEFMETSIPDVYAGGDIARAPVLGQKASIGHWGLANYHGHIAAFNMLGQKKPLHAIPFFWTMLFGKSMRYAGYAQKFDDVVIDGEVEELKFIAFYCDGDTVAAVGTMNRDPLAAKFAEMLHEGKRLYKNNIAAWLM